MINRITNVPSGEPHVPVSRQTSGRHSITLPALSELTPTIFVNHVNYATHDYTSEVARHIESWVRSRLALREPRSGGKNERTALAEAYRDSLHVIERTGSELMSFQDAVLASHIRPAADAYEVGNIEQQVSEQFEFLKANRSPFAPVPSLSALSAALFEQDAATIFDTLAADLDDRVKTLASNFANSLAIGTVNRAYGICQWAGADTCRFFYWTSPIYRNRLRKRQSNFTIVGALAQTDLFNATLTPRLPGSLRVPPRVRPLLASIPPVIKPLVSFLDGQVLSHRVIEWDNDKVIGERRRDEAYLRSLLRFDPAILIGPYVIAGWAEDDFYTATPSALDTISSIYRKLIESIQIIRS